MIRNIRVDQPPVASEKSVEQGIYTMLYRYKTPKDKSERGGTGDKHRMLESRVDLAMCGIVHGGPNHMEDEQGADAHAENHVPDF
jgi:hypothetical protein